MAVDLNMKSIIGVPLKLLFSILCLKCNYVNACVVTTVEKTLMKPVKKGYMEPKSAFSYCYWSTLLRSLFKRALPAQPTPENSSGKVMSAALSMLLASQNALCHEGIQSENIKGTIRKTTDFLSKIFSNL